MIFHASADISYYNKFYNIFFDSLRILYENKIETSFNFVGDEQLNPSLTDYFTQEFISKDELQRKFKVQGKQLLGYYALSRWLSIPEKNDHVLVCDIDILANNHLNLDYLSEKIEKHKVVNLTRNKPNGSAGGMMMIGIHKHLCAEVNGLALDLAINSKLRWDTDTKVRGFLYKNYNVYNMLAMGNLAKGRTNEAHLPFLFCKTNKNREKILKKKYKELVDLSDKSD